MRADLGQIHSILSRPAVLCFRYLKDQGERDMTITAHSMGYGYSYFSFTYFGKAFRGLAGNVCV